MKNFYCKKEVLKDKTPIVLRLQRRHTMDAHEDNTQDGKRKLSGRAASIDNLDMLSDGPSRGQARSRGVTKCLSEDVLSKGQSKVPKRIITEAELSSSLLYKAMQESVNARFKSPNKTPIPNIPPTGDLTPILLQDPKMKPVPVKSGRSRRNSRCCQFATIALITVCTIGFLAAVGGVVYMEFFAKDLTTSHETSEKPSDLSELVFVSQERHNEVNTLVRKDQTVQKSSNEGTDSNNINNSLKKTENHKGTNAATLDTKTSVKELNQYLNDENTKIKFQDGETVIYEVKPSNSMEYEESSNDLENFKERLLVNFNETEDNSLADKNGSEEVTNEKVDAKFGNPQTYSDLQIHKMLDVSDEVEGDTDVESKSIEDSRETSQEVKKAGPETLIESDGSDTNVDLLDSSKDNVHEIDTGDIGPQLDPESSESHSENEIQIVEDNKADKERKQESQLNLEILPTAHYADQDEEQVLTDHNVESMIMVVDDTEDEEVFPDTFISNRNGDIIPLETTTPKLTNPTSMKTNSKQSVTEEKVFTQKQFFKPVLPKRPVDMKVSLAEAMKHLQVLDVNNKILMSRKKTAKPKVDSTKKWKQNISQKERDAALEKEKYLRKVRLMMYGFQ